MFHNLCERITETTEKETLSPKFTPKRGWQLPGLFYRNQYLQNKNSCFFLTSCFIFIFYVF